MRILGLDIGSKRIGVAISDPLGITAQGLATLAAGDRNKLTGDLDEIIKANDVAKIVIGLPLNMNGTRGPQAENAVKFRDTIKDKFGIPVMLWDERLTTAEVERVMIEADVSRKKRKKKIDTLAAQAMLQSYLDAKASHV